MTLIIKPLDETKYEAVKSFVTLCDSSKDFAIISEVDTGTFHCPIVDRDVKITNGICTETRGSCKEHK